VETGSAGARTASPGAMRILRWVAFVPAAFGVALAGLIVTLLLLNRFEDVWLVIPLMALGMGAAVYVASRVAPSRRRWPVAIASVALVVALAFLLSFTANGDREARGLAVSGAGGVVVGALLSLRRLQAAPVQAIRRTAGKSLRYKGTAPFQDSAVDRRTFFGRDREARSLLSLALAERLVVVFGKSGTGKSSLINAGLVDPLLERGYLPMTIRLTDRARGPIGGLLDGVHAAARAADVEIAGGGDANLATFFKTAEFWSAANDLLQPMLILDQFEELFTLHESARRRDFIVQLADVVRGPAKLKILLSLREDHLADLEELARDIPGILQHRFRVGPLTAANAREAIVRPAALEHPDFETPPFAYSEEALQRILGFLARRRQGSETVSGDEVEPVQLQLVCQYVETLVPTRPMRRDGTGVRITEADLGGEVQLQRVLEEFYDRTVASIPSPAERRRIQRLCEQRLISSVGRRLTEAEEEIEQRHGVSADTLQRLVDARLLRPEPRLGGMFYELSHDTLVAPIRRSRQKRVARERRVWVGTAALVVAYFGFWWVFTGRDNRTRQQALAFAATSLPTRDDPGQLLALPRGRLAAIDEQFRNTVATRDEYAAMMFAAEDVGLRYPELTADVQKLRTLMTEQFNRAYGLKAVGADDASSNRRIPIAGGAFEMGSPEGSGDPSEHPQRRIAVSPFRIQEHEVTNAEYRRFDPNHDRLAAADLPVVNVTWYEAMAYAAWLGGSLPTEAQWELAARNTAGRLYPWGADAPTCARANFMDCGSTLLPVRNGRDQGRTPEQVYDLAGNAWEWCRDWYGVYGQSEKDPLGPSGGSARVVRGGSFFNSPYELRGVNRYSSGPEERNKSLGFRVVWRTAGATPN